MSHVNATPTTSRVFRNPLDIVILAVANRFGSKAKEVERFLKFAVVGAVGAVVDFTTLIVVQATILPPEDSLKVALATSIAFLAAVINNFIWNRFWTYPDSRTNSVRRQLAQFTFISAVGWLGRTAWISLAYLPLGLWLMPSALPIARLIRPGYVPSETGAAKLGTIVAMLIGIAVVMIWNFFANRYWTYKDVK